MNDEIAERLHALPPDLPDQPDRFDLVRGRVVRRRRKRTTISSVLAAVVVVAGVSVATASSGPSQGDRVDAADQADTSGSQPFPDPPSGSKWVGTNGVVVAVPSAWPVVVGPCGTGSENQVSVDTGAAERGCPDVPRARVEFAPLDERNHQLKGPLVCTNSEPQLCRSRLSFPDQGVSISFWLASGQDALMNDILDSAMALPDGWTTVPVGGEDLMSTRTTLLEDAGFTVDAPNYDRDLAVRSEPESGSPVPRGATITLRPLESDPETQTLSVSSGGFGYDVAPGSARWIAASDTLVYRTGFTDELDGLCLTGRGSATGSGESVTLALEDLGPGVDCDPTPPGTYFNVVGLTEAPTDVSVTAGGQTFPVRMASVPPDAETPTDDGRVDSIVGSWRIGLTGLVSSDGKELIDTYRDVELTLTLNPDGTFTGDDSCNRVGGSYTFEGRDLRFDVTDVSAAACDRDPRLATRLELVRHVTENTAKPGILLHRGNWQIYLVLSPL